MIRDEDSRLIAKEYLKKLDALGKERAFVFRNIILNFNVSPHRFERHVVVDYLANTLTRHFQNNHFFDVLLAKKIILHRKDGFFCVPPGQIKRVYEFDRKKFVEIF